MRTRCTDLGLHVVWCLRLAPLGGVCIWLADGTALAGDPSSQLQLQAQAIEVILGAADRICVTPPLEQHNQRVELTGDAKAKLDGVLAKVAELGVDGAVKFQSGSSKGVLQEKLADALKNNGDCKLTVLATLKAMIPGLTAEPPPSISNAVTSLSETIDEAGYFSLAAHVNYSGDHGLVELSVCALQDDVRMCGASGVKLSRPDSDYILRARIGPIAGDWAGRVVDPNRPVTFEACLMQLHHAPHSGFEFGCNNFKRLPH